MNWDNIGLPILAGAVVCLTITAMSVSLIWAWMCHTIGQWWSAPLELGLVVIAAWFAKSAFGLSSAIWEFIRS